MGDTRIKPAEDQTVGGIKNNHTGVRNGTNEIQQNERQAGLKTQSDSNRPSPY